MPEAVSRTRTWAWFAVLGLAGVWLVALMVPAHTENRVTEAYGNLLHGPAFALFALLGHRYLSRVRKLRFPTADLVTLLVVSAFGVGSELLQRLGSRTASLGDLEANLLGAVAGTLAGQAMVSKAFQVRWATGGRLQPTVG